MDEFYGFKKSRKPSIFVIYSYLKDGAFTAVKGILKGYHLSIEGIRKEHSLAYISRKTANKKQFLFKMGQKILKSLLINVKTFGTSSMKFHTFVRSEP